jgi:hypothetical protein
MKTTFTVLLFLIFTLPSFSQRLPGGVSPNDDENVNGRKRNNFYAGFVLKGVNFSNSWGLELGGKVGANLNQSWILGLGFYSLLTKNIIIPGTNFSNAPILTLGYGCAEIEYSVKISDNIRISSHLSPGIGKADYQNSTFYGAETYTPGDWFFFAEPGLSFDFRLYQTFWLGIGYNYRLSFGVNLDGLRDNDLTGSILTLTLSTASF